MGDLEGTRRAEESPGDILSEILVCLQSPVSKLKAQEAHEDRDS